MVRVHGPQLIAVVRVMTEGSRGEDRAAEGSMSIVSGSRTRVIPELSCTVLKL